MTSSSPTASQPQFSVVIPVYNEAESLKELHCRLTAILGPMGTYELVFVDDGSHDASWNLILELSSDPHVVGLKFSRNFGHHIALTAGLDAASGQYVITMDADLQDQPEEIPRLFQKLTAGYDVVFGIRKEKKHSFLKRLTSTLFMKMMARIGETPIPMNSHIFRIMTAKFVAAFRKFREQDRFITGLFSWMGFRQTGVSVEHGQRFAGKTKYGLKKMVRLGLNSITSFSSLPLQLSTIIGALLGLFALIYGIKVLFDKQLFDMAVTGWKWVFIFMTFLAGLQLFFNGLTGLYLHRVYTEVKNRPLYIIAETTAHSKTERQGFPAGAEMKS